MPSCPCACTLPTRRFCFWKVHPAGLIGRYYVLGGSRISAFVPRNKRRSPPSDLTEQASYRRPHSQTHPSPGNAKLSAVLTHNKYSPRRLSMSHAIVLSSPKLQKTFYIQAANCLLHAVAPDGNRRAGASAPHLTQLGGVVHTTSSNQANAKVTPVPIVPVKLLRVIISSLRGYS